MPDRTGRGADKKDAVLRPDESLEHPKSGQPVHDLTGGNVWIPALLAASMPLSDNYDPVIEGLLNQGAAALTLDLTQGIPMDPDALLRGAARSHSNLVRAASISHLDYNPLTGACRFRINNHTGHKLISGFPEGRRMFVSIRLKSGDRLIWTVNPYDESASTLKGLHHPQSPPLTGAEEVMDRLVYECKMSSSITGEEQTFHFVLADGRYKDNRIPPKGYRRIEAAGRHAEPVWKGVPSPDYFTPDEYAGGYDEVDCLLPPGADEVEVKLYYQSTSREYIEFLRDEINGTVQTLSGPGAGGDPPYLIQSDPFFGGLKAWGDTIYALWNHTRQWPGAAPVLMTEAELELDTDDEDHDRLPNWWETVYFGGPTNAVVSGDPDLDEQDNWQEFMQLSNPTNSASTWNIQMLDPQLYGENLLFRVGFSAHAARSYQLQHTPVMQPPEWLDAAPLRSGMETWFEEPVTNSSDRGYYRVKIGL